MAIQETITGTSEGTEVNPIETTSSYTIGTITGAGRVELQHKAPGVDRWVTLAVGGDSPVLTPDPAYLYRFASYGVTVPVQTYFGP